MTTRFFNVLMGLLALVVLGYSIYGAHAADITVAPSMLVGFVSPLLLLLLLAAYAHWRNGPRLVDMCLAFFWSMVTAALAFLPTYLAARHPAPLQDALLARVDRALGLEVPQVLQALQQVPTLQLTLGYCYASLSFLMVLAMIIITLSGDGRAAKEYLITVVVAALVAIPLTAVFQAVGPWSYYGFAPDAEQAKTMKIFFQLRAPGHFTLDKTTLVGLIAFPSFHTILALVPAIALRHYRVVRWFASLWAALIIVSTITTGWHYIADVVGGIGLAGAAALAARGCTVLEERRARLSNAHVLWTPATATDHALDGIGARAAMPPARVGTSRSPEAPPY